MHNDVDVAYRQIKVGIDALDGPKQDEDLPSKLPNVEEIEEESSDAMPFEENSEEKALRSSPSSPFAHHFRKIWQSIESNCEEPTCKRNYFFNPALCEILLHDYLPTAPLWSGILIPFFFPGSSKEAPTRFTSGKMENSIKALKEEDFNGEKKIPIHLYVKKRLQMTLGRQRLFYKGVVQNSKCPTKAQVSRLRNCLNEPSPPTKKVKMHKPSPPPAKRKPKPVEEKWNKRMQKSKNTKFPKLGRFQQSPVKPFPDCLHDIEKKREAGKKFRQTKNSTEKAQNHTSQEIFSVPEVGNGPVKL